MKTSQINSTISKPTRHIRVFDDSDQDPYLVREKLEEASVCSDCGARYHEGRWRWGKTVISSGKRKVRCAACQRLLENMPAGIVTLEGEFSVKNRNELLSMIHHLEAREKNEHPLQRIMEIVPTPDQLLLTTTDIHLARGIGEALKRAYKGKLGFHFSKDKFVLRVHWQR